MTGLVGRNGQGKSVLLTLLAQDFTPTSGSIRWLVPFYWVRQLQRLQGLRLALHELSGGERLKVALLAVLIGENAPTLLLLDEPDNHLDLDSRLLLEQTLADYPGALLVVSHDPAFIAALGVSASLVLNPTSPTHQRQ
ncbi:MAG: ATP-binding cassette domain-containing protein [Thiothrix litoralis]|uniref:ATP-binding cassette domain-containing protein n=1 Tax=Thiothrix litoralis TaxID=2891210 RepID=UPI001D17DF6D|nr:ATP-binding cassette domain-containing protein [Thiothrix litoralis]